MGDGTLRRFQVPAALFGLTLAIRVGVALRTAAIFNDGPSFLRVAGLFYQGEWSAALAHHYHPLYPFLTSLAARLTGDFETAAVTVSVVAGSVAVLALYDFLRRAFDARVAWVGGVLFALQPYAAVFSADVQSEGLYFALFLLTLSSLWRAVEEQAVSWALVSGLLAGASYWVRPEGLGLVAVGVGLAAWLLFRGRWSAPLFVRWSGALALAAGLLVAPYVVHLHESTGEWMLTQKKSIADFTEAPGEFVSPAPGTPDRQRFRPPPMRRASMLPAAIDIEPRSLAAGAELLQVSVGALRPEFVVLIAIGLFSMRGRPRDRGSLLLLIVVLYGVVLYGLALNVGYLNRRHVMAPLLPLLGYAAVGAPVLGRGIRRLFRPRADIRGSELSAWIAIGIVALITLPKTLAHHRDERLATRRAAEWLASRADLSGPVAAEKYRTAYYAGEAFIHLSRGEPGGDVELLRDEGADFLVVDNAGVAKRPALSSMRDSLVLLHRVDAAGRTAFVYDLREADVPESAAR